MFANTTVTVGSGKAIHWGSDCGTICGAAHRNGFFTAPKTVKADGATCKRCINIMTTTVENDHELALIDNRNHNDAQAVASADVQPATQWTATDEGVSVQVTRVASSPYPRVSFRRADGQTGTLPLPWFLARYTPALDVEAAHLEALHADKARDHFAAAAEELKADDLDRSAKLVALLTGPEVLATVPDTVEAWKAYADRVKASRDATEDEVARLLRGVLALADRWERTAASGGVVVDPWLVLRALARGSR